jgi:beta-lactamase class A
LTRWSVHITDAASGEVLFSRHPDRTLRTASIGKLLLLEHVAILLASAATDPDELLTRTEEDRVEDSGIWQYLATDTLPVADLCELVGMASDNLATNVLLRRFGLAEVAVTAAGNGLRRTALHDRVRTTRGGSDPLTLSTGSAGELTALLVRLAGQRRAGDAAAIRMLDWLAKGLDLSLVAAGWGLDPLAHRDPDRGLLACNKTGTDDGVRAEAGLLTGPARTVAYTVIANWTETDRADRRTEVLRRMRRLGRRIEDAARGGTGW